MLDLAEIKHAIEDDLLQHNIVTGYTIVIEPPVLMVEVKGKRYGCMQYPIRNWTLTENCIPTPFTSYKEVVSLIKGELQNEE